MRHITLPCMGLFVIALANPVAAQTAAAPSIPLCEGLTVVTAISGKDGDYESIKTVEKMDTTQLRLKYSAEAMTMDLFEATPSLKKSLMYRTVLLKDLATARLYYQKYLDKSAEAIPGTTAIGTSAAVLRDLKTKGTAAMSISNAYPGLELGADRNKRPNFYDYVQPGQLKKVGTSKFTVLVNGQPAELPAIQATGAMSGDSAEFVFLDDERNPLALSFKIAIDPSKPAGARDVLRVIKINYPCASVTAPVNALEKALEDTGKADLYSIYFSFGSDAIRDESTPALREIADVLKRHPDWKLRVAGHTDAIGDDASNLDLSRRRAAAVKDALVKRYAVDEARLSTTGFGRSQPKDTNDTVDGRARNRRVELARTP
jgi:outer membrane protein OmpA-like peptidoglycan-associated protein